MSTLFISDLHLDPSRPDIMAGFRAVLEDRAPAADALYILGDLFEAWVGDDDDSPVAREACGALRTLSATGLPVYFLRGNRDFLVGEAFGERTGVRVLPERHIVEVAGRPTLLLHGDELCTDDVAYQAMRRQLRDPAWQAQMLSRPIAERRAMAEQLRAQSRDATSAKAEEIMDVNQQAVEKALLGAGVRHMIHGHTHRPATHRFELRGESAQRVVLGDWHERGNVLVCDGDECRLEWFDLPATG